MNYQQEISNGLGGMYIKMLKRIVLILIILVPIVSAQNNHSYPRTGVFHWGGAPPDWYAKFDLVITCVMDSWFAEEIKAINPDALVISSVRDWNTFSREPVADEWYCRDSNGNYINIYGGNAKLIDFTDFCLQSAQYGNMRYNEYLPKFVAEAVDLNIYDGVSSHGVWEEPWKVDNIDLNRDGVNDYDDPSRGKDWVHDRWLEGVEKVIADLKNRIGNKILVLNSGRFHTFGMENTNGPNLEDERYLASFNHFKSVYDEWMQFSPEPHSMIYDAMGDKKEDFYWMRFHLGACMYGDGYVGYHEMDAQEHFYNSYYDEQDLDLGFPTGPMRQLTDGGDRGYGTYVRFFDKGVVILNVDVKDATVTDAMISSMPGYDGPYYRFQGGQDPDFNTGLLFDEVYLRGRADGTQNTVGDAILLTKEPTVIVSDIVVDSDDEGTSPGSDPAQYNGSWEHINDCERAYTQYEARWKDMWSLAYTKAGSGNNTARFTPAIGIPGNYTVYEWHGNIPGENEASNVPYEIHHANGVETGIINQSRDYGQWIDLGTFYFDKGIAGYFEINDNANGVVVADAVKFVFQDGTQVVDTTPPKIHSVMSKSTTKVEIRFTESVEISSAENANNYVIDKGINVFQASMTQNSRVVALTTSKHIVGETYTITVNNVRDRANEPNVIAANSQAEYVAVSDNPLKITISADEMYELYVNGVFAGSGSGWKDAETYEVQTTLNNNVIAIRADNERYDAGLVAQIEFREQLIVTNENWKISTTEHAGWNTLNFDDLLWLKATSYGVHGTAEPWAQYGNVDGISKTNGVEWIWSADNQQDKIVWFRFLIRTSADTDAPQPPMNVDITIK